MTWEGSKYVRIREDQRAMVEREWDDDRDEERFRAWTTDADGWAKPGPTFPTMEAAIGWAEEHLSEVVCELGEGVG